MKLGWKALLMIGVGLFALTIEASAAFSCGANVNKVLIYANGVVNVLHSGRGDFTYVCNLKSERQGVSITTCAMWASMLIDYEKNDKKAIFYYDNSSGYGSCSELPTYGAAPAPVYIGNAD